MAAFLFDLTGGVTESNNQTLQYPGRYLIEANYSCRANAGGTWYNMRQVRDFVFCLEDNLDANAWNTYFSDLPAPTAVSNSATKPAGWSASNIRSAWLWNFFSQ